MYGDVEFTLSYEGEEADDHAIDFYDVSQALVGFERSLALTTHLVINGTIITQAPALHGARIIAIPAETGSWKQTAVVVDKNGNGPPLRGTMRGRCGSRCRQHGPVRHCRMVQPSMASSESTASPVTLNTAVRSALPRKATEWLAGRISSTRSDPVCLYHAMHGLAGATGGISGDRWGGERAAERF